MLISKFLMTEDGVQRTEYKRQITEAGSQISDKSDLESLSSDLRFFPSHVQLIMEVFSNVQRNEKKMQIL
jgi:hypothetical protein